MRQAHIATGGRYPVLRTIAILWLVSALIEFVGGVSQAIVALANLHAYKLVDIGGLAWSGRIMAFFIWLAATFFLVILNIAIAEMIKLAIDVEHNTRMTAMNTAGAPVAAAPAGVRLDNGGDANEESAEAALIRGR